MNNKSALIAQLRLDHDKIPPPKRRRLLRWLGVSLCVIAAGVVVWILAAQTGVPVQIVEAKAATEASGASSVLDASGYVVAKRQATIAAKITDKVVTVLIEEGQHVEADQIIATLDDSNTRASLNQARAQADLAQVNVNVARAALDNVQPIFDRRRQLSSAGWASMSDYETTKLFYDNAAGNLSLASQTLIAAQAGVEVAQRNQDDTIVRAPYAGIVTVKAAQPGEVVSPISAGGGFTRTGICTIVDMNSLEVEVDVSENFIHRVHAGQAATVRLNAYPDWTIPAEVAAIVPTADRSKAIVKVRVSFKQLDPRILPEMGARVAFFDDPSVSSNDRLGVSVPLDAVVAQGDEGVVFVIRNGRVERRQVKLGARSQDKQIILSGLGPDEQLAAGDLSKLSDGSRITSNPQQGELSGSKTARE